MIRLSAAALLCALSTMPAVAQDIFAGVRSINVTMTKEETCIASQYGVGDGYHGRRTASGERFNGLRHDGRPPHQALRQPRHGHEQGQWSVGAGPDQRPRPIHQRALHRPVSSSSQRLGMGGTTPVVVRCAHSRKVGPTARWGDRRRAQPRERRAGCLSAIAILLGIQDPFPNIFDREALMSYDSTEDVYG